MTDAAARREARMRRILENADNRLKKISTLSSGPSTDPEEKPVIKPTPPPEVIKIQHQHAPEEEIQEDEPLLPSEPVRFSKEPERPEVVQQKDTPIHNYRVFIIMLLGISVRYMNLIFDQFESLIGIDLSFMRIEKIFVPMLCYELTELLFFKPFIEENSAFNLILSLNNINPNKFKKLFRVINFCIGILKDMSIYFFAFVIIDLLFSIVEI